MWKAEKRSITKVFKDIWMCFTYLPFTYLFFQCSWDEILLNYNKNNASPTKMQKFEINSFYFLQESLTKNV
jgi:hypothetical protein